MKIKEKLKEIADKVKEAKIKHDKYKEERQKNAIKNAQKRLAFEKKEAQIRKLDQQRQKIATQYKTVRKTEPMALGMGTGGGFGSMQIGGLNQTSKPKPKIIKKKKNIKKIVYYR